MLHERMFTDLDDLRIFAQVVDSGSLTAAGHVLGVSTAFVSRRLQNLERRVGRSLIHRTTRSLSVSDDGVRLYGHAVRMLHEAAEAEAALLGDDAALVGSLRVAVPSLTLRIGMLERLMRFLGEHPHLSVQLHVVDTEVDVIAEGYDVAIRGGSLRDSSLIAAHMITVHPALGACPSYLDRAGRPQTPADLVDHECLRFVSDRPQATWGLVGPDGQLEVVDVSGRFQSSSSEALVQAMIAGLGIGIHAFVDPRIERVLPGYTFEPIPIYATYPSGLRGSKRLRAFLDVMRAAFSAAVEPE